MNLVVVTEDLDEAERGICASLNAIPNSTPQTAYHPALLELGPFDVTQSNFFEVVPVKETYSIELVFPLPSLVQHYASVPAAYWGEVIGDEGHGSAISVLRDRGLASSLSAGVGHEQTYENNLYSLFTISVVLSKAGFERWQSVLKTIMAYIKLVVDAGPQSDLWEQYRSMSCASFEWAEQKDPVETAESVAIAMQTYPWGDILRGPIVWQTFSPDRMIAVGAKLNIQNCLVILVGPSDDSETFQTEPWFGTKYRESRLASDFMDDLSLAVDPALTLPKRSPLIPKSFTLVPRGPSDPTYPQVILERGNLRMWHFLEQRHQTPRAYISLRFYSASVYDSPVAAVSSRLIALLLEDSLMEYLYQGEVAELSMSIRETRRCMEFQADGFTDRLFEFTQHILFQSPQSLLQAQFTADRFALVKERLQVGWASAYFAPAEQVTYERLRVLQVPKYSIEELREALDRIQLSDVAEVLRRLRSSTFIEGFIHGNVSAADADTFANDLQAAWNAPGGRTRDEDIPQTALSVLLLPKGSCSCRAQSSFNEHEDNSAHVSYYQLGVDTVPDRTRLKLLQRIASEMCFDALRTRAQLGYTVTMDHINTDGVLGLTIEVVSAKYSAMECESAVDDWIRDELMPAISSMTPESLDNHIEGFVMDIEAQDFSLSATHDRLWAEIVAQTYVFDRIDREVDTADRIKRRDLVSLLTKLVGTATRAKLSTHILGRNSPAYDGRSIDSIATFQGECPLRHVIPLSRKVPT